MATAFENFVNAELPKRISTEQDPLTTPVDKVFVTTGVGLTTECKAYGGGGGSSTNLIINGAMDIWQIGTTFNQVGHEAYSADMFMLRRHLPGGGFIDIDKETTIIPDSFSTSMKLSVDTARGVPAASEYVYLAQRIEGYNYRNIIGEENILSFWVRSSETGTYCVALRNSDATRSYVAEYSISVADTWEHKTITLTFNATGTWQKTHLVGLEVCFVLMAGTDHQGTKDTWNSANQLATSNQIGTWLAGTDHTFYISGIQLASSDTYAFRTIQEEIDACERYYEKSYNLTVNPGTATFLGSSSMWCYGATAYVTGIERVFKTRKRATPTMAFYSPNSGAINNAFDSAGADIGVTTIWYCNENSTGWPFLVSTVTATATCYIQWIANSRL